MPSTSAFMCVLPISLQSMPAARRWSPRVCSPTRKGKLFHCAPWDDTYRPV